MNRSLSEYLPFGKAPTVILAVTILAAAYLAVNPVPEPDSTLRLWTFARNHYLAYLQGTPSFEAAHPGTRLEIQLVHGDAVSRRLRAAFWADLDVPDLVEVGIDRAASFFRGPVDDVGFIDLTPRVVFPLTELGARQFSDAVSQAPVAVNGDSLVIDMDGLNARFVTLTD